MVLVPYIFAGIRNRAMPVTQNSPAPYAPASVIIGLIDRYRSKGLPTPITPEILARAGVSDSLVPRTFQALQTLDLLSIEAMPTQTLEGLRLAPETDYKTALGDWVKAAYADAMAFIEPATASETEVRDTFRHYKPVGQQERMVSLFLGLCEAAGLVPERKRKSPAKSNGAPKPRAPVTKRQITEQNIAAMNQAAPVHPQHSVHTKSHSTTQLPPALAGLMASLPPQGETWTQVDRNRFMATFGAVLDFCFPVTTRKQQKPVSEDEEDAE